MINRRNSKMASNTNSIYVSSKSEHAEMWRLARDSDYPGIFSSWINENTGLSGQGSQPPPWVNVLSEISRCYALVLFWDMENDWNLKGSYVEVGMAIALGVPVFVAAPETKDELATEDYDEDYDEYEDETTDRSLGHWTNHPNVIVLTNEHALEQCLRLASVTHEEQLGILTSILNSESVVSNKADCAAIGKFMANALEENESQVSLWHEDDFVDSEDSSLKEPYPDIILNGRPLSVKPFDILSYYELRRLAGIEDPNVVATTTVSGPGRYSRTITKNDKLIVEPGMVIYCGVASNG